MAFNNSDLDKSFRSIEIDGFELKNEIMGYSWTQVFQDRSYKMNIGYSGYPNSYRIYTPSAYIYFDKIEKVLLESFNKTKIISRWGETGTVRKVFVNLPAIDYTLFDTDIDNEFTFNKVANEIRKIINSDVLTFFEQYNTLEKVWVDLEQMKLEEMVNFIGQPLPFRRMIIKKLCNDKNFENYATQIIDNYERKKLPELAVLKELYQTLKEA